MGYRERLGPKGAELEGRAQGISWVLAPGLPLGPSGLSECTWITVRQVFCNLISTGELSSKPWPGNE